MDAQKADMGELGEKTITDFLRVPASARLMEESHQNTPENEIRMQKQKHSIYS